MIRKIILSVIILFLLSFNLVSSQNFDDDYTYTYKDVTIEITYANDEYLGSRLFTIIYYKMSTTSYYGYDWRFNTEDIKVISENDIYGCDGVTARVNNIIYIYGELDSEIRELELEKDYSEEMLETSFYFDSNTRIYGIFLFEGGFDYTKPFDLIEECGYNEKGCFSFYDVVF